MEHDIYRERLIDAATGSYTRGVIDQGDFETLVTRLNAADSSSQLELITSQLPQVFGGLSLRPAGALPAPIWRDLKLNMGNLKKSGEWVDADGYQLAGRMSNFELDLRNYDGVTGFRLGLHVDLDMSNLKLFLPDGWLVTCNLDSNTASNVKDKGPSSVWGDNHIEIRGSLRMSNIKVKYY